MAHWPQVEPMPGIEAVLAGLSGCHLLLLATNAVDSDATLVETALRRIGLDRTFHRVITSHEAGARKPEPAFFRYVLGRAGCAASEAVMIGDDYRVDVAGAKGAGLRAFWYNPAMARCPDLHPLCDAELPSWGALPGVLAAPRCPDVAECLALLAEHGAPPELVDHCRAVAGVAFRLAERLRRSFDCARHTAPGSAQDAGEEVSPLLAHRGGLLHDIAKPVGRRSSQPHTLLAGEWLEELGYPALARIAARHAIWSILEGEAQPSTWEEKLVFYADRLIEGDRLVGIPARAASLAGRRPEVADAVRQALPATLALEAEIAGRLGLTPAEMVAWLEAALAPPEKRVA
jgi:putative hydrolase of the HAD superfamily